MIAVEKRNIILSSSNNKFENKGVVNPRIYQERNTVHILHREAQNRNISTIGYAKRDGPLNIVERHNQPLINRDFDYESREVEDARIVKIEDTYYIGAGSPPIETAERRILIYQRLQETTTGHVYCAKAALLQLDKLEVEIARLNILLLSPSNNGK